MSSKAITTSQSALWVQRCAAWITANRIPLAAFAVSRLGIVLVMYAAILMLPVRMDAGRERSFPDNLFLDGLVRWDSYYYVKIAESGYKLDTTSEGFTVTNFFPLYPLVTRIVSLAFEDIETSGLIVSNVSFLFALLLLYRFVADHYGPDVARRTVLLWSFSPFSYYFSAMYTESLYTLAAIAAFYLAERDRWALAAVAAAFAGAARIPGITVAVGIGVLYLEKMRAQNRWFDRRVFWLPVAALGTLLVMLYFGVTLGDPLIFRRNQGDIMSGLEGIRRLLTQLVQPSLLATGEVHISDATHVLLLLLALILLATVMCWQRKAYALWVAVGLLVAVPAWWGGYGRFTLPLFPLFIAAALLLKRPALFQSVLYLSAMFLSLFAVVFASWNWIA